MLQVLDTRVADDLARRAVRLVDLTVDRRTVVLSNVDVRYARRREGRDRKKLEERARERHERRDRDPRRYTARPTHTSMKIAEPGTLLDIFSSPCLRPAIMADHRLLLK